MGIILIDLTVNWITWKRVGTYNMPNIFYYNIVELHGPQIKIFIENLQSIYFPITL